MLPGRWTRTAPRRCGGTSAKTPWRCTLPSSPDVADDVGRSRWVTAPLYLLLAAVVTADIWGALFWARVGGSLGMAVAAVGAVVAVGLVTVLATDLRRHRSP